MTAKYGALYSPEPPLALLDIASMLSALADERGIKTSRHNIKERKRNIIKFSRSGLAGYPTLPSSQLGCVWIFNHQYKLVSISPAKICIAYKRFGIHKDADASIHHLSRQRKWLRESTFLRLAIQGVRFAQ